MNPESPHHALRRMAQAVTLAASCLRLSATMQASRRPPPSQSWKSLGARNVHRFLILVLVALCLVTTASSAQPPLIVRTARGGAIVYLFPFVALSRYDQPRGSTPVRLYSLQISRWLNEPELAGQTGDTPLHPLVSAITTLGVDRARCVLYGHGHTPEPGAFPDTERFFVIAADRAYYFRQRDEWISFLRERCGIKEPKPEDVGALFQTLSKGA